MRSVVLSILVIFVLRTYAKDLMIPIGNTHNSMHKLVGKLIDKMPHHADLEYTTLGKTGRKLDHVGMSFQSHEFNSLQPRPLFSQPWPLFQRLCTMP